MRILSCARPIPGFRFSIILLAIIALNGCKPRASGPLWNVPAVIGQPIDTAMKTLGQPQAMSSVAPGLQQSEWRRDGKTLAATWKTSNKRVTAWTLQDREEANALREAARAEILTTARLKENDPRYSLEWIEARERPLFYTGVKVIPAPKNHNTVLRVTSSTALVQVSYQVSGTQAKSESFLTIAPWETALVLPDDSKVAMTVELRKNMGGLAFNMKCEVLEDGVVKASQSSTGTTISCNYEF